MTNICEKLKLKNKSMILYHILYFIFNIHYIFDIWRIKGLSSNGYLQEMEGAPGFWLLLCSTAEAREVSYIITMTTPFISKKKYIYTGFRLQIRFLRAPDCEENFFSQKGSLLININFQKVCLQ